MLTCFPNKFKSIFFRWFKLVINLDDIPITIDINDINAGDDYDLCFTVPKSKFDNTFYKIGEVTEGLEIKLTSNKGYDIDINGYEHF